MIGAIRRLPFSLDPLMAEAKRRARQRRVLIGLGVLLLAGLAAGLTFAFRSPGGGSPNGGGLTTASYSQLGFSLRYPAAWTRLGCTNWVAGSYGTPVSLLTSARPAPTCGQSRANFPPNIRLAADGTAVFLTRGPDFGFKANTSIDGRPARVQPPTFGATPKYWGAGYLSSVICPAGATPEARAAYIKPPHPNAMFTVGAVICGPQFSSGDAAVRNLIASMRFANGTK